MEIIKVFSDIEGDERLYSVLMNEKELDFLQREFAAINPIKNGLRKLGRNLKVAKEKMSLIKSMATGRDLTAKQTHALHRDQRLSLMKNKTVRGIDPFGRTPMKGKARDMINPENIDVLRQAERAGNGMERGFVGYIPKPKW